MSLFEDHKDNDEISFKVNKNFAEKFTQRKKREELEKGKAKYGKIFDG